MSKAERFRAVFEFLRSKGFVRTQKEFAEMIGLGANNLSSAFKGDERYLTDGTFRKVSKATNGLINSEWMLTGEGAMATQNVIQNVGNGSSNNTLVAGNCDIAVLQERINLLERLLEEKERTIKILLQKM